MRRIAIDYETRSRVDLKKAGVYAYSACPDFKILMMAWSIDGAPAKITCDGDRITSLLNNWLSHDDVVIVAHNAPFERVTSSRHLGLEGFLAPTRFDDTAARAAEYGLPRNLKNLATALKCTPKDEAGMRLINLFCKPVPTGKRKGQWNDETTHPEDWEKFKAYCRQDVDTLVEVDAKLPQWPSQIERDAWDLDQIINDRGLPIDVELAKMAQKAALDNRMGDELRVTMLTGIINPGSNPQMMKWLDGAVPNLQEETVTKALAGDEITPLQREVLELRQELALSAASKYAAALLGVAPDDRVRGQFTFFGAHTGRWSSRGIQVQNLPRVAFKSDGEVDAAILDLKLGLGGSPLTLKKLIRPMFVGPFTIVDFASIEARVIAWLADELWALEAFTAGRDIYVETAARFGPEFTRQQGKTAVLACGFGGGVNALRRMGAVGEDDELQVLVDAYRMANPKIVLLWRRLRENIAEGGRVGSRLAIRRVGDSMRLHLPSGRAIHYHGMKYGRYTIPDPEDPEQRITKTSWRFADPDSQGRLKGLYFGTLVENATQAIARDLLVEAMLRLEEHGYVILGHVHDEVILEGEHDVDTIVKIMCELPSWASGLPMDAEGQTTFRYKK